LVNTRTVPVTVRLRATASRTVPVTAQLGAAATTYTRTVPLQIKSYWHYEHTVPVTARFRQDRQVPVLGSLRAHSQRTTPLRLITGLPLVSPRGVSLALLTALQDQQRTVPLHMPTGRPLSERGVPQTLLTKYFNLQHTVPLQLLDGGFYSARGPRWITQVVRLQAHGERTVPLGLVAGDARPGVHVTQYSLDLVLYRADQTQVSQFVIEVIVPRRLGGPYGQMVG